MRPPSGEPVRWPSACKTPTEECTKVKKIIGVSVFICLASFAQKKGRGGQSQGGGRPAAVGGGHIPARGPAPAQPSQQARPATPVRGQQAPAVPENRIRADQKGHPELPHVHAKNDQWVGHNSGPN